MRERGAPTVEELAVWLQVCSPVTARGTLVRTAGTSSGNVGWVSFGGPPAITVLPSDVPVEVAFRAPGSWRLDVPDGPLARSDGRRSAVWKDGAVEAGEGLLVLGGPADLLQPSDRPGADGAGHRRSGTTEHDAVAGSVTADVLLGRACWRWEHPDGVLWVDELTGCLLRRQDQHGDLRWTRIAFEAPVEDELFALPDDLPAPPPSGLPDRPPRGGAARREPPPLPGFRVPWWPLGCESHPVAGDLDVPELLVELHGDTAGDGGPRFWVGVGPAGRPAPVRSRRLPSRQWDGDGCSLALSWRGDVPADVVDRVVASVPATW